MVDKSTLDGLRIDRSQETRRRKPWLVILPVALVVIALGAWALTRSPAKEVRVARATPQRRAVERSSVADAEIALAISSPCVVRLRTSASIRLSRDWLSTRRLATSAASANRLRKTMRRVRLEKPPRVTIRQTRRIGATAED